MLSSPEDGWTVFRPGSEKTAYSLSYLNDIAVEWLDQAIHGLKTMDTFSVHGFCEPGRMICTVSYWNCYIIFEGDGRDDVCESVYTVHVSMIDFCKKLYADIAGPLEEWVHWDDGMFEDEEDPAAAAEKRRKEILERLETLKGLIAEKEEEFAEDGCFI